MSNSQYPRGSWRHQSSAGGCTPWELGIGYWLLDIESVIGA
jgi:hypothetical protein